MLAIDRRGENVQPYGRSAPNLMILGTSSGVGKTLVTAAICRWLASNGVAAAPFKAVSMQMGRVSYHPAMGGEIHLQQLCQARAANAEPSGDMNPIVLRQIGNEVETVILGEYSATISQLSAAARVQFLRTAIVDAYARLSKAYTCIVIEGCGSPVELNLKERDLANLWLAETLDAPCLLVANVENTGVFASLLGTLSLMTERERSRVVGFVVNKFHGSVADFDDGVRILEDKARLPCFGVIPFVTASEVGGRAGLSIDGSIDELRLRAQFVLEHLCHEHLRRCLLRQ